MFWAEWLKSFKRLQTWALEEHRNQKISLQALGSQPLDPETTVLESKLSALNFRLASLDEIIGKIQRPDAKIGEDEYLRATVVTSDILRGLSATAKLLAERYSIVTKGISDLTGQGSDYVLYDIFRTIFGETYVSQLQFLPNVTFDPEHNYTFDVYSMVANIPPYEEGIVASLIPLFHEVSEAKVYKIKDISDTLVRRYNAGEKEDFIDHSEDGRDLRLLFPQRTDCAGAFFDSFYEVASILSEKLDPLYPKLTNVSVTEEKPSADQWHSQVTEILADLLSLFASGPADILATSCIWADLHKNTQWGVRRHLLDLYHPPACLRVRFGLHVLKSDLMGYPASLVNTWGEIMDRIIGTDDSPEVGIPDLYEEYFRTLTSGEDGIYEALSAMACLVLPQDRIYNYKRWEKGREVYDILTSQMTIPADASTTHLLNAAWRAKMDIYSDDLRTKSHGFEENVNRTIISYFASNFRKQIAKRGS